MARFVTGTSSGWLHLAIVIVMVLLGALGLRATYDALTVYQNQNRVATLARDVLARADLAVDYAVITLSDVVSEGLDSCELEELSEIRRAIYLRGAIKDVQVYGEGGVLRCAGLPQSLELNVMQFDPEAGIAALNGNILLQDVGMESSGLLGVVWRFGSQLTLLAVVNVDNLMFDVFPAALRDSSTAELMLGDDVMAQHLAAAPAPAERTLVFHAASERYPLAVKLSVDRDALAGWDHTFGNWALLVGGFLGLVIGAVITALLNKPADPHQIMQTALNNGEFVPFAQPLFSLADNRIVGCEILARWIKPDGTLVPPANFVLLAEESGLIVPITRELIRTSLKQLSPALRRDPEMKVAFNIVPGDLVSEPFADDMSALAAQAKVSRDQIVLEITERQEFEDREKAAISIRQLRDLGFRVALDDTGTGHNGLSYVQKLGIDIIKIDKHFVDLVGVDRVATKIIQMLVRLAKDLDITTVAEGIETEVQREALKGCGVDQGQGYLVSPPVPIKSFLSLVAAQAPDAKQDAAA